MTKIEIGIDKKGEPAILKVMEGTSWSEIPELRDVYKPIKTIDIPPEYDLVPGKIDRKYLLEIFSKEEEKIGEIKKMLVEGTPCSKKE